MPEMVLYLEFFIYIRAKTGRGFTGSAESGKIRARHIKAGSRLLCRSLFVCRATGASYPALG
jgi:hypothetical protein